MTDHNREVPNTRCNQIRLQPRWIPLWNEIINDDICVELAMKDFVFSSPASSNYLRRRGQRFMTLTFLYKVRFQQIVNPDLDVILDIWDYHICQLFCNPVNVSVQNNFRCLYKK